ncbi:hypothetical protein QTO34_008548 [Cnephaeus nilssonii]|uniref:PKD domain-containing protein n=1 Tax=Cnephaeus nilssonii TaxID=3371016 RepID=A0AA40LWF5_CNENI|nr:hypothetical protein QTO34_008548 [Eptesicus nilssonii]
MQKGSHGPMPALKAVLACGGQSHPSRQRPLEPWGSGVHQGRAPCCVLPFADQEAEAQNGKWASERDPHVLAPEPWPLSPAPTCWPPRAGPSALAPQCWPPAWPLSWPHLPSVFQILFLSSSLSSGEQHLFLSTDEATTFQKQLVPFTVDKLIFHPKDEDKVLACTPDGQLYVSCDLGRRWLLLHEQVTKDHVFWGRRRGPGAHGGPGPCRRNPYVTAHVHNCSSRKLSSLFAGPIDHRSLLLQNEFIFFKATSGNQTKYYVSYRHNEFAQMKLPKYALPKDLQVISTDESQVLVAVQEWYQTDTYNLYQSDPRGVLYSLVLEDVRSSRQAEEGVMVDVLEVHGVKGVFLANQKANGKVTTLITYNQGRDWDRLRPPREDMNGKPTHCQPPDCHLHLHLLWADNPYVSGTVHTKETAPGLIMGAGNLGSQLVEYKEEMYITSDCGRTWRQVFEEEHHILYLDHGGVIVAVKDSSIPLKILKFSTDEGLTWSTYNFTDTSVFVDGLLSEPGEETLVITIFGHISYRSEWELVKVDFRPSFPRPCRAEDYGAWDLTNLQGDGCLMGQRRSFRKRKATAWCVNGRNFTAALTAQACPCQDSDFLCDYGFERSLSNTNKCFANFWFNPLAPPDDCVQGQTYTSSLGYRKVVANLCQGGVDLARNPAPLPCPLTPPRGLRVSIIGQAVAVRPGEDVLFEVRQEQGDFQANTALCCPLAPGSCHSTALESELEPHGTSPLPRGPESMGLGHGASVGFLQGDVLTTKCQVDLGDGSKPLPVNLTLRRERIRHRYESPGVYRVSVRAENVVGHDEAVLFVQVNPPLQALHLEVVPVIGINEEVTLTAVLLPLNPNLTVFYWWIGLSLQPLLSLNSSVATRFVDTGEVRVTVQAACGSSVLQASKVVRVLDQFEVVPLQFSRNLDTYNPNTPEWREDVGQVVSWLLAKETAIPAELLVTVIAPGLPTVASLYVLPPPPGPSSVRSVSGDQVPAGLRPVLPRGGTPTAGDRSARLLSLMDAVLPPPPRGRTPGPTWPPSLAAVRQALSAQKIGFLLRAGVRVLVALGPDTRSRRPGGGGSSWVVAVLLVIGLFPVGGLLLYKKRPDRTVYAQMHNAKEPEMTSPLGHGQGVPGAVQREDFIDGDLHSQTLGNHSGVVLSINSREMHSYLRPAEEPPPPAAPTQGPGAPASAQDARGAADCRPPWTPARGHRCPPALGTSPPLDSRGCAGPWDPRPGLTCGGRAGPLAQGGGPAGLPPSGTADPLSPRCTWTGSSPPRAGLLGAVSAGARPPASESLRPRPCHASCRTAPHPHPQTAGDGKHLCRSCGHSHRGGGQSPRLGNLSQNAQGCSVASGTLPPGPEGPRLACPWEPQAAAPQPASRRRPAGALLPRWGPGREAQAAVVLTASGATWEPRHRRVRVGGRACPSLCNADPEAQRGGDFPRPDSSRGRGASEPALGPGPCSPLTGPESGTLPRGPRVSSGVCSPFALNRNQSPSPSSSTHWPLPPSRPLGRPLPGTPEPGLVTCWPGWGENSPLEQWGTPPVRRPVSPVGTPRPQGEGVPVGPSPPLPTSGGSGASSRGHLQTRPEDGGGGWGVRSLKTPWGALCPTPTAPACKCRTPSRPEGRVGMACPGHRPCPSSSVPAGDPL